MAALVRRATNLATKGNRPCYSRRPDLLPWSGGDATSRCQCCYKGAMRCCHGASKMLPVPADIATKGALCCYHGAAALLQMVFDFATRADHRCYLGVAALLPMARRRCCKRQRCRKGAVVLQGATTFLLRWTTMILHRRHRVSFLRRPQRLAEGIRGSGISPYLVNMRPYITLLNENKFLWRRLCLTLH
jgi:hypothetical protein